MPATFDRAAVMQKAHSRTRAMMKVPAYRGAGYRALFAAALKRAWSEATADRREMARHESNLGLPLRSCLADAPTRPHAIRFGSMRVFTGPGAREAAIEAYSARVGGRFQQSQSNGRRAMEWA
jgi:hypothetical protein